jgi:chorismate dehydratase
MRVGKTYFKNTDFIYYYIDNTAASPREIEYIKAHPPDLGEMLLRGEVDIAPVSSIIYGQHHRELYILPEFSISALGKTMSILLFSEKFSSLDDLEGKTIAIPSTTASSSALLDIILRMKNIKVEFVSHPPPILDSMLSKADAALLIGDHALKENYNGRRYICDLGEEWRKATGEKMVYALWVISRVAAEQKRHELEKFYEDMVYSREKAYENIDAVSSALAERLGVSAAFMRAHLESLDYGLDERGLRGLEVYFGKAFEFGILEEVPELNFFGVCKC